MTATRFAKIVLWTAVSAYAVILTVTLPVVGL